MSRISVFAPGSIGNVGPGFDVLGLAVDEIGDRVTLQLTADPSRVSVTGRDAELVPTDPEKNAAVVAAIAWLRAHDDQRNVDVQIEKGLPLSGGLGGSAASSVAGAYAAAVAATNREPDLDDIIVAALEGEASVAGRHLDNIAPSVLGGLTLVRSVDPVDVIRIDVRAPWWVVLITPDVRIETRLARSILPETLRRGEWVQQMANTAAVVIAFATGDANLLRRALDDGYAEPHRAPLIPRFPFVKQAAMTNGAFGCSMSGSGPTLFAIVGDEPGAHRCADAMQEAFGDITSTRHISRIGTRGVRTV